MWLRDNGCEWNADVCAEAARGGHIDVLKWAHRNGCPADERVGECAAETGKLEMLLWVLENKLPRSVPMLVLMMVVEVEVMLLQVDFFKNGFRMRKSG